MTTTDESDQVVQRRANLDELRKLGVAPYPNRFDRQASIDELVQAHGGKGSEELEAARIATRTAGRILAIRSFGKANFLVLSDGNARIQVYIREDALSPRDFQIFKLLDFGDWIGVEGRLFRTKTKELTIWASQLEFLAKCLLPLPEKWHGLTDIEIRFRQRYLDLIVNPDARRVFEIRSRVVTAVREFLIGRGFLEVETPMMQSIPGGALARPFVTYHNALDMKLFLRIAPELFLKRAVVGGIDRVYEINRNFRNEGADSTHSPEFSMLEAYEAYGDYNSIADLTQTLIQDAAFAISGSHVVTWADGTEFDLGGDWDRISMYDSLSAALGTPVSPETSIAELKALADREGVDIDHPIHGKYVEELWEHFVKDGLTRPTFVMDFPVDTSPLVRGHRSIAGVVEKWDLYVRGFELATGYSELVDPVVQRERFVEQARLAAGGDPEAMRLDEEFLRALEYGMPPTGGMGMGIDRLLMALTGLGIRETILFPLVK